MKASPFEEDLGFPERRRGIGLISNAALLNESDLWNAGSSST